MKKVVSILLAGLFAACLFTSCNSDDKSVSSSEANGQANKNSSTVATTSAPSKSEDSSSKKGGINRGSSESVGQSVKYYNKGTIGLGAHEFNLDLCIASGNDYESKLEEYSDVVKEGYFNTYFLSLDENILAQMKVVAEAEGTVWLAGTRNITDSNFDSVIKDIEFYLELLDKHGYKDLVNGFYWYEPLWNGTLNNNEFLKLTKTIYQKFGLRNFPTLTPHNFVDYTGKESAESADKDSIMLPSSLQYVTDISFTSYGYDVRDGAKIPAGKLESLHKTVSPKIKTPGDYYIYLKEKLHAHAGHLVNTWYYACSYNAPVAVGLNGLERADEGYCIGHLNFMADDVLKSEYQGGIIIHKYHIKDGFGFQRHLPLKDSKGEYKYYPDDIKWDDYGRALKEVKEKFDSQKANLVKL